MNSIPAFCSALRRFSVLILLLVGLFLLPSVLSTVQAQSGSRRNQERADARRLMHEMSETEEAEETNFEFGSDFDSEEVSRFRTPQTEAERESEDSGQTKGQNGSKDKKMGKSRSTGKSRTPQTGKSSGKSSGKSTGKSSGKSSVKSSGKSKKARGKQAAKEEPVDTRTPEEKERDRMAFFRESGIWLWPELTEEQAAAEVQRQKEYLETIKAKFPQTLYYESEHFFYLTDAPEPIARECLKYLEAMFARLCDVFEFQQGARVWTGKCIVCAFVFQQQFLQFEEQFFGDTSQQFTGASGLAHMSSDGNVLISLFYGDISTMEARWKFIGVLVHESTHGFLHRYRARQNIPLWLNEGIADFMPGVIVPADRQQSYKQRSALEMMRQTGSVGGLMSTDGPLQAWQYGAASGLVGFLLKQNPHAFKQFLDDVKDGKDWSSALKEHYKCTPEELLFHFGRANRIPALRF